MVRKKQKNIKFISNLNSIPRAKINNKSKKVHYEILKCFTSYEKKLSNYQKLSKGYQKLLKVIHNLFNFNRKEVTRIDKNGEEITKNIFYRLQFTDSARFMARSLSNRVNNLAEGIHKIKRKYGQDDKKRRTCRNKYNYCNYFFEYANFNDDLMEYKCSCCKNYQKQFDEKLSETFFNIYTFSNHDNNKFILFLRKGVYLLICG